MAGDATGAGRGSIAASSARARVNARLRRVPHFSAQLNQMRNCGIFEVFQPILENSKDHPGYHALQW